MAEIDGVRIPGLNSGAGPAQTGFSALETARRIAAAVKANAAAHAGDSVELSPAPVDALQPAHSTGAGPLSEIETLLKQVHAQVAAVRDNPGLTPAERQAIQSEIDAALDQIDRVAINGALHRNPFFGGFGSVYYGGGSPLARGVGVYDASLAPGQRLNIDVVVTQSAQAATLLLNLGGSRLDLAGADERFELEIAGAGGSHELSFASGASLAEIAAAINAFTGQTGVEAVVVASGLGGVALRSVGFGASDFVGVRVLNDGGIQSGAAGLYRAQAHNFYAFDPASHVALASASSPGGIIDVGQALAGTINGVAAAAIGDFELYVETPTYAASVRLHPSFDSIGAFRTGAFRARSIFGDQFNGVAEGPNDPLSPVVPPDGPVATRALGQVGVVEGASTRGALRDVRAGGAFNVVNGDVQGALASIERALFEIGILRARQSDPAPRQIADPAAVAAEARRELLSRSAKTIIDALGGAPRADRFG